MTTLQADYIVIGAGAMGMAFVDEILTHSNATVAMIDKHAKPGGHWNDAYPFVRLHQPSFFYGVSSTRLGTDELDQVGLNAGLSELASGAEVCAYFDHIMQRRFLPTGRVEYLPGAEYRDGVATQLASGVTVEVQANRAVVDATYMNVTVPSVQPPAYEVDPEVVVIPPNQLPTIERPDGGYTVVGAGKTAFDALMWLLANGVDQADICWIMPRDSWLLNRAVIQPGDNLRIGEQVDIFASAESADDVFTRFEAAGHFFRIDPDIEPTMYRCATVTEGELAELRKITNIIRGARVAKVSPTSIDLVGDDGAATMDAKTGTVYVDCTADALERLPVRPVFAADRITLQTLRGCQQVFSAGLIGRIETLDGETIDQKNELATVIPHPDTPHDYLTNSLAHIHNAVRWGQHSEIAAWLEASRLSPSGGSGSGDLSVAIKAVRKLEAFIDE